MYYEIENSVVNENEPVKVIANQIVIHNIFTDRRTLHKLPKEAIIDGTAWMGDDRSVLFSYSEQDDAPRNIYRYDLNSRKMTQLTDFPLGHAYFPHWVEGSLAVSQQDKLTTCWGSLKQK